MEFTVDAHVKPENNPCPSEKKKIKEGKNL
jgi:hypothetical protein